MSMGHDVIHRFSIPFREAINTLLADEQIDADAYEVRVMNGCVLIDLINPVIVHKDSSGAAPAPFNVPVGEKAEAAAAPAEKEEAVSEEPAQDQGSDETPADEVTEDEVVEADEPPSEAEEKEAERVAAIAQGQDEMFYQSGEKDPPFDGGKLIDKKKAAGNIDSEDNPHRRSQRCAILCDDRRFQTFMDVSTKEAAADAVRNTCQVKSRSEFDKDPKAAREWDMLLIDYQNWLKE